MRPAPLPTVRAKFDLTVDVTEQVDATGRRRADGDADVSDRPAGRGDGDGAGGALGALAAAAAAPDTPLHRLPVLTPEERHTLLVDANPTSATAPTVPLPVLFEQQVTRTPSRSCATTRRSPMKS